MREREAKEQKLYRNVGSKFERVSAIRCAWCGQSAKSVSHSFKVNRGGWAVEKVHGRVYSCWTVVFIISITFSTLNSWTGVEKKCLPAKRKTRKMLRTENRKKCCHLSERRRRRWEKKNPVMSNKNLKQFFPEVHEKYERQRVSEWKKSGQRWKWLKMKQ